MLRKLCNTKGYPTFLRVLDKILAVAITKTIMAGLPMSIKRKNASYNSILLIVGLYNEPMQIPINVPGLQKPLLPSTQCQRSRLSLDLKVLVPPVLLLSLTAVTTEKG